MMINRHRLLCTILEVLLLSVFVCVAASAGGDPVDSICAVLNPDICLEDDVYVPVGYTVVTCPGASNACGINITTEKRQLCPGSMMEERDSAQALCSCFEDLSSLLAKAPALVQTGNKQAMNPFRGVQLGLLAGVGEAEDCITAQPGVQQEDVNRQQLWLQLNSTVPLKVLAGVRVYNLSTMPSINTTTYLHLMELLGSCLNVSVSEPINDSSEVKYKINLVPWVCKDFVEWYSAYAGDTITSTVSEVDRASTMFVGYLSQVLIGLNNVTTALEGMIGNSSYDSFLKAAAAAAANISCPDANTCFGGLIAETWHRLQYDVPASLNSTNPALQQTRQVALLVADFLRQSAMTACEANKKLLDAEYRRLWIYRALVLALREQGITNMKALLNFGPRIAAEVMVYVAGLPALQGLDYPVNTMAKQLSLLDTAVEGAVDEYQSALQQGMMTVVDRQREILSMMPGVAGNGTCPDGSQAMQCTVNRCQLNSSTAAAPTCGANKTCIMDSCANCNAKCVVAPPSPAVASKALRVLQAWLAGLRGNRAFTDGAGSIKVTMPRIVSSMTFIQAAGSAAGDRVYMYKAGLLAYNRRALLADSYPCAGPKRRKCYRYLQFEECMSYQTVGACEVVEPIALPNGHMPWVSVHAGLDAMMLRAYELLLGQAQQQQQQQQLPPLPTNALDQYCKYVS